MPKTNKSPSPPKTTPSQPKQLSQRILDAKKRRADLMAIKRPDYNAPAVIPPQGSFAPHFARPLSSSALASATPSGAEAKVPASPSSKTATTQLISSFFSPQRSTFSSLPVAPLASSSSALPTPSSAPASAPPPLFPQPAPILSHLHSSLLESKLPSLPILPLGLGPSLTHLPSPSPSSSLLNRRRPIAQLSPLLPPLPAASQSPSWWPPPRTPRAACATCRATRRARWAP